MDRTVPDNPNRRWKNHPWQLRTAGFSRPPEKASRLANYANEELSERRRERRLSEER